MSMVMRRILIAGQVYEQHSGESYWRRPDGGTHSFAKMAALKRKFGFEAVNVVCPEYGESCPGCWFCTPCEEATRG